MNALFLMLVSSAVAARADVPSVEITRYLSRGGYEQIKLECISESAGKCAISWLRNGTRVESKSIALKVARRTLDQYFADRGERAPSNLMPESKKNLLISWRIRDGRRKSVGSEAKNNPEFSTELQAILLLELDLATRGL